MFKILIILLPIFVSCSFLDKKKEDYPLNYQRDIAREDYLLSLENLAKNFNKINTDKIKIFDEKNNIYVKKMRERIYRKNEILLTDSNSIKIVIVKSNKIFYFSTPGGFIYLSSELVKRYLKSESLFVALVLNELIKSKLGIYNKNLTIPRENYTEEELIRLTRISLEERTKLNQLVYEVMKRSGYDPGAKLLWLQVQNRNSIDFYRMYENTTDTIREEFYMKNYIVSQGNTSFEYETNSSKEYYQFRNLVR